MAPDISTCSDTELVQQTQAGSLVAFEQLVYRYEHRLHAFVARYCHNATDAREVTQDTFVKASQSMKQFDVRREFAPWLFTIARRKCVDRHRAMPPRDDAPMLELVDNNNPGELLAQHEDRQHIWQLARCCLSENQFQALCLRYLEDMDVSQIAQVLGKTRVHVKVLLFRARQTLGRRLNSQNIAQGIAAVKISPDDSYDSHQITSQIAPIKQMAQNTP